MIPCDRYDLALVDTLEAFAAEGIATFGGCVADESAAKQLEDLLLASMRTSLGYRGKALNLSICIERILHVDTFTI